MAGIVGDELVVIERSFEQRKPNRRSRSSRLLSEEERRARGRARALKQARKVAQRQAMERRRGRVAAILSRPAAKACRCGLSARVSDEQLQALGAGCTGPSYICATLDAVRRVVAS